MFFMLLATKPLSGTLTVTGYISGSSLYVGDCDFNVAGGLIGIGTCDPKCDVDIYANVCHTSGHFINYSGQISGQSGIFDWVSGNSGYMLNEFTVGTGDCTFIVTTGGKVGINTCDPKCDVDIYANVCHTSGNFTNYSGYISGQSGIFDWLSGNSGYMRNEFTVGTGDCTFIVTTGGKVGINTCDPKCDVDIYANVCHSSGNFTNYSGYVSGQSGIFDWLSGNSGYMRNEFTVGTGDCAFIVTTGGDIGINTCKPKCGVDIYANVCHTSGNFTNYSGRISGQSGILDWVSGHSGYFRGIGVDEYIYHNGDNDTYIQFVDDEMHLAAGGRTFIKLEEASQDKITINHGALNIDLKVGGENQVNLIRTDAANDRVGIATGTPDSQFQVGDLLRVENEDNMVRISGQLWISGSDGAPCQVICPPVVTCGPTDWVEAFDEDENGDLQPWSGDCINDTAWFLKKDGDLEPRANYFSCCSSEDLMMS